MTSEPLKTAVQIDLAIRAVEVKTTARIEDEDLALGLLKQSGEDPEARTVFFSDTPALSCSMPGWCSGRARSKADVDDTTVKLRPVDPARISIDWMKTEGFEVEMDRVGDKEVISAKLSVEQQQGEIDDAVSGKRPLQKLFSTDRSASSPSWGPLTWAGTRSR